MTNITFARKLRVYALLQKFFLKHPRPWARSIVTTVLVSPVCAYLFGIAPQILTVPVIMLGNALYVAALHLLGAGKGKLWKSVLALAVAAVGKFLLLFVLVKFGICGILADGLMEAGLLKAPMLSALPASFSAIQLVTALVGGGVALLITPALKKALKRN